MGTMTLILTVVDKNRILQVSDRRLTNLSREIVSDETNKAVCIGMSYIHFAASYTGLAYIGKERIENRTDYWLLEQLGSITRSGTPSVDGICRSLGQVASTALSRLRGNYKPLEVVFAGYERNNIAFRATVSNMKVNKRGHIETRDRFTSDVRRFYPWSPKPEMYVAGASAVFDANDRTSKALGINRDKVIQYLKANRDELPEQRAAEALVWLTRAAHTHKDYGYLIGRDCLSTVAFPREPQRKVLLTHTVVYPAQHERNSLFTSFYHPVGASSVFHAPHLADYYMDYMNVEADTNPEGADPPPLNQPVGRNLSSRVRIKVHNLPEGNETILGLSDS